MTSKKFSEFEDFCNKSRYGFISCEKLFSSIKQKKPVIFEHGKFKVRVRFSKFVDKEIVKTLKKDNPFNYMIMSLNQSFKLVKDGKQISVPYVAKKNLYWIIVAQKEMEIQKDFIKKLNIKTMIFMEEKNLKIIK